MQNSILSNIKKHKYYYFFTKLLVFFIILFVIDFSIGSTLNYFYFKQKSGVEFRTTYSIEKTEADVLIFGSSRATHHYIPTIFENRLKMSYYNVGRDGNFIFYHDAILRGILKRYSPKIVVLDLINGEFKKNELGYDRLSILLPYYRTHPEIRSIIELKSKYEKYKLISRIYPFNSSILKIAVGNTNLNEKRSPAIKGYMPITKMMDKPSKDTSDFSPIQYEIDYNKVKCFIDFVNDCNSAGIKLFIFVSPYFEKLTQADYSVRIALEIAKKYDVKLFDFSNDPAFTSNRLLFADLIHLNDDGARLYSNLILDKIFYDNHIK